MFAPQSEALEASVTLQIRQAVDRWLSDQVGLREVQVVSGGFDPSQGLDEGEFRILVSYVVIDSLTPRQLELKVQ